jgi:hypothetical protein
VNANIKARGLFISITPIVQKGVALGVAPRGTHNNQARATS